jgi:hypothetical protein
MDRALRDHAHELASNGTAILSRKPVDKGDAQGPTTRAQHGEAAQAGGAGAATATDVAEKTHDPDRPERLRDAAIEWYLVRDLAYQPAATDSKPVLSAALLNLQYRV